MTGGETVQGLVVCEKDAEALWSFFSASSEYIMGRFEQGYAGPAFSLYGGSSWNS